MSATHFIRRRGKVIFWVAAILAMLFVAFLLLPALQEPRKSRRSQAWKNLRQIRLALINYCSEHGSLPYHPEGPEYALYLLSEQLPESCFDAYPHNDPNRDAHWDHENKRLVNADYQYTNRQNIGFQFSQMIVLAEKPNASYQSITLVTCDGSDTHCKRPETLEQDLFDTFRSWDHFLVNDHVLWQRWESVPLPNPPGGETSVATSQAAEGSIWNSATIKRIRGPVTVHYAYKRGQLVRRTYDCAAGRIVDTVTTDELGRIVAFERSPSDWESFWPYSQSNP